MISHAGWWPVGRIALALVVSCLLSRSAEAQVYGLAELNIDQIRMLDRQRTVILIPGGILEEHGPYLPSFTDGYLNERLTEDLAAAIAKRPGWAAVVFPIIPLGSDGANRIGEKHVFPGSYPIRTATLRAVFMDLATEFGEQGFQWIFVIHGHGSPNHNRALDQAGEYFRDTYGGHMVNLTGLQPDPQSHCLHPGGRSRHGCPRGGRLHCARGPGRAQSDHGSAARPRTRGGGERSVGDRKGPRRSTPNRGWREVERVLWCTALCFGIAWPPTVRGAEPGADCTCLAHSRRPRRPSNPAIYRVGHEAASWGSCS